MKLIFVLMLLLVLVLRRIDGVYHSSSLQWGTKFNLHKPIYFIPNQAKQLQLQQQKYPRFSQRQQQELIQQRGFLIPSVILGAYRRLWARKQQAHHTTERYIYPSDNNFNGGTVLLETSSLSSPTPPSMLSNTLGVSKELENARRMLPISEQEPMNPFDYYNRGPGVGTVHGGGYGMLHRQSSAFYPGQDDQISSSIPILSPHQDKNLEGFSPTFTYAHYQAQPLNQPYGPQQSPLYQANTYLYDSINRPEPWPMDLKKYNVPEHRYTTAWGRADTIAQTNWPTDDPQKIADAMWITQRSSEMVGNAYAPKFEPPDNDLAITQGFSSWERVMNTKASVPPSAMED